MLRRTQPSNASNPRRIRLVISLEEGRGKERKYIKSRSGSFNAQSDLPQTYNLGELLEAAMQALEARWGR